MQTQFFNAAAPKKPLNLSINSDLLKQAKALRLNLSQVFERQLIEVVRQAYRRQWLQENQAALKDYNRHIERNGVFSDKFRRF